MKRVAAICGSLRGASYNRCLMREAATRAPRFGLQLLDVPIAGFPLYNDDIPEPPLDVLSAKDTIQSCDCLLLVTPEYNYGIPGTLKNAVDWLSRPVGDATLFARPMALMGVSSGYMGTLRAQMAWRQLWHYFHAPVFSEVEMTISFAARAFDASGRLVNEEMAERLETYLLALRTWIDRLECEG